MNRPRFVYDDSCRFCTWFAEQTIQYSPITLVGLSNVTDEQRERLPDDFENCSHLITDEGVYSCGKAIEQALAWMFPLLGIVFAFLQDIPRYAATREKLYRLGANNRPWLQKVVSSEPPAEGYTDDRNS